MANYLNVIIEKFSSNYDIVIVSAMSPICL